MDVRSLQRVAFYLFFGDTNFPAVRSRRANRHCPPSRILYGWRHNTTICDLGSRSIASYTTIDVDLAGIGGASRSGICVAVGTQFQGLARDRRILLKRE